MNEFQDHDQDRISEGLRAAFGAGSTPGDSPAAYRSVLRILQQRTASRLDLHLHDVGDDSSVPVRVDDEVRELRDPSGRYQIVGEIGRGGVGVVYKGRDQDLGRDVAMKVLRAEHAERPEILERFVEEAQIGGQLQHPGIVPVYDIGLQHGERPYFAMKLVKGETLAELLARRGDPQQDRRRFLGFFEQVCQTMAYAHARRVVHRDLKPHNVMIGSFGEVQVVDWGFAKVLAKTTAVHEPREQTVAESVVATVRSHPEQGSRSVVGSTMGTPAYMPPEQALGQVEQMDARSDVFGLGAVLCEILTGKPPYLAADGDLVVQSARADLGGAFERIDRSGADQAMIELCKQCLAPSRMARPASAREVAEQVASWLSSVEERARQAQIRAAEARVRARSTVLLSAAAVLLLVIGGGGYLYVEQEARARRDLASQRVAAAISEADQRLGQARAAGIEDLGIWDRALDAARQAEQLAGEPDVGDGLRSTVAELFETAATERGHAKDRAERRARDDAMRQALIEARIPTDDNIFEPGYEVVDTRRQVRDYAAAYSDYLEGVDIVAMEPAAAADALRGELEVELAAGLDHWAMGLRFLARQPGQAADRASDPSRLRAISDALDPDPWRSRLRNLTTGVELDRAALLELRANAELESLPVISLFLLATALRTAGADGDVREVLEVAVRRFPRDFSSAFMLAIFHETENDFAEAQHYLRIARAIRPDLREVQHRLAMALWRTGALTESERMFESLIAEDPDNGHWHFHLGTQDQSAGRVAESVEHYRDVLRREPEDAAALHNLGQAMIKLGDLDEGEALHRRVVELNPQDASCYRVLSWIHLQRRQLPEALAMAQRALELDPGSAVSHSSMSAAQLAMGRVEDAMASARKALELGPHDSGAHDAMAQVLERRGDFAGAVEHFRLALAVEPDLEDIHVRLGQLLGRMGDVEAALVHLRRVAELRPNDSRAQSDLGSALNYLGHREEALVALERALELEPDLAPAHYNCSQAFWAGGFLQEALESARRAEQLWRQEDTDFARQWLQRVRLDIQRLEISADDLDRLLDAARGEPSRLSETDAMRMGDLLFRRGEAWHAVRCFQAAFAKSADLRRSPIACYNAACAAARVAAGRDSSGVELGDEERTEHRRLAFGWARSVVDRWRDEVAAGGSLREAASEGLEMLLNSQNFQGVRTAESLDGLPAEQAEPWRALWTEAERLLQSARTR